MAFKRLSPTFADNRAVLLTHFLTAIVLASCSGVTGSSDLPSHVAASSAFSLQRSSPMLAEAFEPHRLSSKAYRVLFSFGSNVNGFDGVLPEADLVNLNGRLYGTTVLGGTYGNEYQYGFGTVFAFGSDGKENVLHSFSGGNDGSYPLAGMIDVNGTLYGTTSAGGTYGGGTAFIITASGAEHVLHSFGDKTDGSSSQGALIAVKGELYGTTYEGGTYAKGTVFSLSVSNGKERVLHNFGNGSDGAYPVSRLIEANGVLFGTTEFGGTSCCGTIFRVSTSGATIVLHSFTGHPDGAYPQAGLTFLESRLYGTTYAGGTSNNGTIFSIHTDGTREKVLHSFGGGSDGAQPEADLLAVNQKLYGTTYSGGTAGSGVIFSVTPKGRERVLHAFGLGYKNDGISPKAGVSDLDGTLYGTTYEGGTSLPSCPYTCDDGTIFALTL